MRSRRRARLAGRLLGFAGALLTACSAVLFLASPAFAQECQWQSNFNPQIRKPVGQGIAGSAWHNLIEFEGTVDFGDGETIPVSVGTPFEHVFTEPGTYTVTSSGKGVGLDTAGNRVACEAQGFGVTTVTVYPLEARFIFEEADGGDDSLVWSFDGSASVPQGEIAQYVWDFADGSFGEGAAPTHTFASPGLFPVTLTVLDVYGNTAQTSKSVGTGGFVAVDLEGYVSKNAREVSSGFGDETESLDAEEVGRDWAELKEIFSFLIDLAPGVGTVKAIYEILDGRDPVTGTVLSDTDRMLSGVALVLSVVGFGWLAKTGKFAKVGPKIQRLASKYLSSWKPARTTRYGAAHKGEMNIGGGADPPKVPEVQKSKLPDGSEDVWEQARRGEPAGQQAAAEEQVSKKLAEKDAREMSDLHEMDEELQRAEKELEQTKREMERRERDERWRKLFESNRDD